MALAALALAGCVAQFRNHGYAPSDSELAEVLVGLDTRDSVIETFGPPTTGGVLEQGAVYYVESRWRLYGALEPQIIDRQLVAISFDPEGVVSNVERFTLEDGRVITLSRRVTDDNVRNTTFIRQLLGNLGRIDNADFLGI
ncbi:outer membrane protein assembly factor BamE [Aaestuariibius violaceus]|uniref:outer membrane protein assembly factor BamE n=1 Tax=Aestuariibius violaceus TaxID=3234132 RepID=UPI00398EE804